MAHKDEIEKLIKKASEKKIDLSSDEDLSIAIMNLVSIEEHFYFTGAKTNKPEYFDLLQKARQIRGELMKKIVKEPEGEIWCLSKHLLATSMRLIEVGTKYDKQGKKKEAYDLYEKAYELYSLFWGLNLKAIDIGGVKKISENQLDIEDKKKGGILGKLQDLVKKVVDCCIE
jgi:hypothetical protein